MRDEHCEVICKTVLECVKHLSTVHTRFMGSSSNATLSTVGKMNDDLYAEVKSIIDTVLKEGGDGGGDSGGTSGEYNGTTSGGGFVAPKILSRGETRAPILSVGVGTMVYVRASSHLRALMGDADSAKVGDEFEVTEELAQRGAGPYTPANDDGVYVDGANVAGCKAFLGAGRYFILCGGSFGGSNNSTLFCMRIA